jgi:transposase-like protein
LSSTRPANHHRAQAAGDCAAQPRNRVFERHTIAAVLPGAHGRYRTPYHRNLLTRVPKSAQLWVSTLVRTIFEQPDAASVRAQHAQVVAALEAKLPAAAAHLGEACEDILAFTAFPREVWRQIWSNNP